MVENRTYREVEVVSLPKTTIVWTPDLEPDECCENYLVCGKSGGESHEMDTTTAWIKLFTATDTADFKLYKDGVLASTQPTEAIFEKETYSKYGVIDWSTVLDADGVGCYELKIDYSIAGFSDTITWGKYSLFEFSPKIVNKTVRIKALFNSNQTIEDINFTDSKIVDTYRFEGYFGDRQPTMEIDNLIYNSREVKKVTRENVNKYTLTTKTLNEVNIRRLTDLYLLSENEIYLSDFNPTNPTYDYLDVPLIVAESPEVKYFDGVRKSTLTVVFNDKVKNSRSFY